MKKKITIVFMLVVLYCAINFMVEWNARQQGILYIVYLGTCIPLYALLKWNFTNQDPPQNS